MFGKKKDRIPTPTSVSLPPEEELPEESFESVVAGLPLDEESTDSETPDKALSDFLDSLDDEPVEEADVNPGVRKRKRKPQDQPRPRSDTLEDEIDTGRRTFKEAHPRLRRFINTVITMLLLLVVVLMILSHVFSSQYLNMPEEMVAEGMTPIQSFFSYVSNAVTGYFRTLKLRSNIESEYNALRARNEELEYEAMRAKILEQQLLAYESLAPEVAANAAMNPLICTVISRDEGNYFSTFTINKGSDDGIEPYMAVTINGALLGYTEQVSPSRSTVRTIIDSEASIAGVIKSSRDQGTVRGTLGIDGTPMCRMYYLPDNRLPRPGDTVVTSGVGMSFPKEIPIGTVRESTRGVEGNKQYIVVEPQADFQHIEYVIVLRYQPDPEPVTARESTSIDLVALDTPRPVPTFVAGSMNYFISPTPTAGDSEAPAATETPTPSPSPSPSPTPTPTPESSSSPASTSLVYVVYNSPSPTPSPTPRPTPTPVVYLDETEFTFEEE